jgi:tRNA pseudouridine13 synthase
VSIEPVTHQFLPKAHGQPLTSVVFKQSMSDFQVYEKLVFSPDGEGEHVYLHVQKQGINTQWLAAQLAKFAGLKKRDVSYAGLKDRNAITTQWFSLLIHPDKEPDWDEINIDGLTVLQRTRHRVKLRPTMVRENEFVITLKNCHADADAIDRRVENIIAVGVPNYYGEQRFGHQYGNIQSALKMFSGQLRVKESRLRGLYLSAARSYLFNKVLAMRVSENLWNKGMDGDVMILDGTNSFFSVDKIDEEIISRLDSKDIHPSGPLWGKGHIIVSADAENLEQRLLKEDTELKTGLEKAGLQMSRKALRMQPKQLRAHWQSEHTLQLTFSLPRGQYATTVLREMFDYQTS